MTHKRNLEKSTRIDEENKKKNRATGIEKNFGIYA